MSEDGETQRVPVPSPKNNVEMFMSLVETFSDLCAIRKIPELGHQVDLLSAAVESYLFQKKHGGNPARMAEEKRRFIVIFKNRFRVSYDYDYPNTITPVELKMIEQHVNNKLKPKHIDSDYYLEWFFDSFLAKKPNFNPATIRLSCSQLCWGDFIYDNRDNLKEKKEQALQESEALDLFNRARESIRRTENIELKTKIAELIKNYRDGSIMFMEFRNRALELEKASRQN